MIYITCDMHADFSRLNKENLDEVLLELGLIDKLLNHKEKGKA